MIHETAFVHPKAHVEDATIGARTKVWQFASVIRGARLGEDCTVASGATVDGSWYGDRVIISQGYAAGPGFKIGNDVFIGPNVTLCNDRWPKTEKDGFSIDIFTAETLTKDGLRPPSRFSVILEDGSSIGANAVILPGCVIGRGSIVAAGAVVRKTVAPGYIYRRDGTFKPIPATWPARMRFVECIST